MIILGINAYHADASAAIVVDGKLVAAAEEERFLRIKHWAGFPIEAIKYCLSEAGISIKDVDHIAISRDPKAHIVQKVLYALKKSPGIGFLKDRARNLANVKGTLNALCKHFEIDKSQLKAKVHFVEHHVSHMASSFYVSPFEKSAVISIDAMGDFMSTMWGIGEGTSINIYGKISFPHSLGFLYTAGTQFLGFPKTFSRPSDDD